jgi:Protein of unknown function (DUF1570)
MKRWLLTVVGLMLTTSLARADYLLLIVNVGQGQSKMNAPAGGMMGMIGGPGMFPPGQQGNRGAMGFKGAGGGQAMGFMGAIGGPAMGGPAMGGPAMGFRGAFGNQGGGQNPSDAPKPILIPLCVELKVTPSLNGIRSFEAGKEQKIFHPWGSGYILPKSGPIVMASFYLSKDNKILPNHFKRFEQEKNRLSKDKDKKIENTLELAEYALSHGLHVQFEDIMNKLADVAEYKADKKILAYLKVKAELDKRVEKTPSAPWFARLSNGYEKETSSLHYTILHRMSGKSSQISDRVKALEHNLKGFYYWWTLRGVALPMPKERLVAMVTTSEDDFKYFHKGLAGGSVVFDGYQTPRENVLVMALEPRAEEYVMLKSVSDEFWGQPGMSKDKMLEGRYKLQSKDQIHAGIMAITLKALEETMEQAAISHDGSLQLLYASGLMPSKVIVPEWVQYGMSSIFETPPGHPWQTLGAPSPLYLPIVKQLRDGKKLEETGVETLKKIVTDSYFRQAHAKPKDHAAEMKAKATAWLLCYHMARDPVKLKAYFEELARMPPDLDLDEQDLLNCFARAFDAWDGNRKKVDEGRLQALVSAWVNEMTFLNLEGEDLIKTIMRLHAEGEKIVASQGNQPGNPMAPGGNKGPGGNNGNGGGNKQ